MILHPTISATPIPMMPGYFQITVRARLVKPLSTGVLKTGYPKATLQGGVVFPPMTQTMSPENGVDDRYVANFTGAAGLYSATLVEKWTFLAETSEVAGIAGPRLVP